MRVLVNLKPTLDGFLFTPMLIEIHPERIDDVIRLIEFQLERLMDDLSGKNFAITNFDQVFDLSRTYVLGVDFP